MDTIKSLTRCFWEIILFTIFLFQTSALYASIGVLHKDKSEMFLFEKVGKTGNLLDNPARLKKIPEYIIYNYFNLVLAHAEPYDPVFAKSTRNDEVGYNAQVIAPIKNLFTVNLGYNYAQQIYENNSTSSIDASYFKETVKTLQRNINAGLAIDIGYFIEHMMIGYSIQYSDQDNLGDYFSNIAQSYAYANNREVYQHKLGVTRDGWGMYVSCTGELYFGEYNQTREVKFWLRTIGTTLRKIWGEIDGGNISISATYANTSLGDQKFEVARPEYQLIIPDNKVNLSGYYHYPQPGIACALGVELNYEETQYYKPAEFVWEDDQVYQAKCQGMLAAEIFPFLRLWTEAALVYVQNTFAGNKSLTLENAFGARIEQDIIRINFYMVPELDVFSGNQADDSQTFRAGMDAQLNF